MGTLRNLRFTRNSLESVRTLLSERHGQAMVEAGIPQQYRGREGGRRRVGTQRGLPWSKSFLPLLAGTFGVDLTVHTPPSETNPGGSDRFRPPPGAVRRSPYTCTGTAHTSTERRSRPPPAGRPTRPMPRTARRPPRSTPSTPARRRARHTLPRSGPRPPRRSGPPPSTRPGARARGRREDRPADSREIRAGREGRAGCGTCSGSGSGRSHGHGHHGAGNHGHPRHRTRHRDRRGHNLPGDTGAHLRTGHPHPEPYPYPYLHRVHRRPERRRWERPRGHQCGGR